MFKLRLFVCLACLLVWALDSHCFAQVERTSSFHKSLPLGDQPGGVSTWTDYRGPEFSGYASIGKTESLNFWASRLKPHGYNHLDSVSYKDLKLLWRARYYGAQAQKNAYSTEGSPNRMDSPDIEFVLTNESSELKAEAQDLADAYAEFRMVSEKSSQERTTGYFEACRQRLVDLVGGNAVRELEETWRAKAPDKKKSADKTRKDSLRN